MLAREHEVSHPSLGAANDPGRAVETLLDAPAALPGLERLVGGADRRLSVLQDPLVVEADQCHGGILILAKELELRLARHILVRRDDRRTLLPVDAVVGG